MTLFDQRKIKILQELASNDPDLSPKGSPDDGVLALLEQLNAHHDYVTTSSCSGRAVVFLDADRDGQGDDARGRWLMNQHTPFTDEVLSKPSLEQLHGLLFGDVNIGPTDDPPVSASRMVSFKFEPLVLFLSSMLMRADFTCFVSRYYCGIPPTPCCHKYRLPGIWNVDFGICDTTTEGHYCHKNNFITPRYTACIIRLRNEHCHTFRFDCNIPL